MDDRGRCEGCGERRPADAPGGLCPACLLKAGLDGPHDVTVTLGPAFSGTLASLAESLGEIPRVLLRDTDQGTDPGSVVRPGSAEMPVDPDGSTRLQLLGEIARGGMGAVLKGRDPAIGRDLAVKVLLDSHRDRPDLVRRFIEEAQISGQLQHPGIVPIYELGAFADCRPYFAMKLVKGRTLSSLLAERPDPSHELSRFLAIFESICQTMAYAHARGVIHRDLKPSNVMVGAFGEVQVMDWGLAKVLPRGGSADDASAGMTTDRETLIATAASGTDSDLSRAGSVLGTPSYMAPEQARGEIDRLDERADVFALGSILCEVLSGFPAFTGRSSGEIQRLAARGDLSPALGRLDACGADPELIALAKSYLSPEPDDRPRHAGTVSTRIAAYRSGVEDRLRRSEIARAAESARAEEALKTAAHERRSRRLTVGLAASILGLGMLGGGGGFWLYEQHRARLSGVRTVLARIQTLHEQAKAKGDDPVQWREALAAADQSLASLGDLTLSAPGRELVTLRALIAKDEKQAERDKKLLADLAEVRRNRVPQESYDPDRKYAEAFRNYGLDLTTIPIDEANARLSSLPQNYRIEMVQFLDDWVSVLMDGDSSRILALARRLDPDPERNKLRTLLEHPKRKDTDDALRAMAKNAHVAEFGPSTSLLLASELLKIGDSAGAIAVLRTTVIRHPGDFWANFTLALTLGYKNPRTTEQPYQPIESIRYYSVARALRPATGNELARLLASLGKSEEAVEVLCDLIRVNPNDVQNWTFLIDTLKAEGPQDKLREYSSRWIAFVREPLRMGIDDSAVHLKTAFVYRYLQDRGDEIAELEQATSRLPKNKYIYQELAHSLILAGDPSAAINAYREAMRLDTEDPLALYELAYALCLAGDHEGEIATLRQAIDLVYVKKKNIGAMKDSDSNLNEISRDSEFIDSYNSSFDQGFLALGNALAEAGDLEGAGDAHRKAIQIEESAAMRYRNFGFYSISTSERWIYSSRHSLELELVLAGDLRGAIDQYREAFRLDPKLISRDFSFSACLSLARSGDLPGAIAVLRGLKSPEAGGLQAFEPRSPEKERRLHTFTLLGPLALEHRTADTLVALHRIREQLGDETDILDNIDRAIFLADRMERIGPHIPRFFHAISRRDYMEICYRNRHYVAAALLWAAAFDADPSLKEGIEGDLFHNAACAAALAGCGKGRSNIPPDDVTKAKFRQQALEWLKADLRLRDKALDRGHCPPCKYDTDFACVRDPDALAKLPEDEREGWQAFWAEVEAFSKRAPKAPP